MKARLTIIFALIVVLPMVVLGWLGMRVASTERVLIEQRFNALMLDRLRDVDASIASLMAKRERELLSLPALSQMSVEQLRALARDSATVRQFFVMNDRDELRYPISADLVHEYVALKTAAVRLLLPSPEQQPANTEEPSFVATLTTEEKAFLDRTHAIWTDKRIPATDVTDATPLMSKSGKKGMPTSTSKGWYAWYWGDGLNLIYWWRDEYGAGVGAELKPVRLAADIVGILPDTNPENTTLSDGSIVLRDSKGGVIYQWGAYEPPGNSLPAASLPLRVPLSSWRLEYHAAPEVVVTGIGRGVIFNLISGLTVLGLAVMALAVYYYRESSREMREATQRVSFVNQVSHELKTPLTSIRMYAEMLEEELDEADEKAQRHVGVIVAESQRLSRLIGNVLTFSRKERNALKLHKAPGNIDNVVRAVIEHFRPTLDAKGFEISFDAGVSNAVQFDRDVLEQILGNLIGNVEKYAISGGHAEIVSRQEDSVVSITVADHGPGIPPRDRNRIFAPFYRVSDKVTDGVAGTGIGLAIARDLARLHGGDLTLEASDRGAKFKVTINASQTDTEGEQP